MLKTYLYRMELNGFSMEEPWTIVFDQMTAKMYQVPIPLRFFTILEQPLI